MAVVAAVELEDEVAARHRPRDAHRAHRGLGAARHEAQHLEVRHALDDTFGELDLEPGGNAERGAELHGTVDRVEHHLGGVAEHERAPREHVVDVLVAVRVPDARALAALGHERFATDAAEGTHRRIHAAWKELARALHDLVRPRGRTTHRPKAPIVGA